MKTLTTFKLGESVWIRNRYNEYVNSGVVTKELSNGEFLFASDEDGLCYSSIMYPDYKYFIS